jgi:hypothetical protein
LQTGFAEAGRLDFSFPPVMGRAPSFYFDPEAWRRALIEKKLPDDFDELPEDEQDQITEELEAVVASYDRASLFEEILQLDLLISRALDLEKREIESKLVKLNS